MPAPENTCPNCGGWRGEEFEFCRECAEEFRDDREERVEREEPVRVSYYARAKETDKAVCFRLPPGGFMARDVWVPRSQLIDEARDARTFTVSRWWAEDNDLAYQDE